MRRRPARKLTTCPADPAEAACVRARKARRQGRTRDEATALRLACALREDDPTLWTLFARALQRLSRTDEAIEALRQALWLRERAGETARARVTRKLLDAASCGVGLSFKAA